MGYPVMQVMNGSQKFTVYKLPSVAEQLKLEEVYNDPTLIPIFDADGQPFCCWCGEKYCRERWDYAQANGRTDGHVCCTCGQTVEYTRIIRYRQRHAKVHLVTKVPGRDDIGQGRKVTRRAG